MYLKAFIQNLVQIGTVVSEKIQFEFCMYTTLGHKVNKNSAEVDITPAFGEITTKSVESEIKVKGTRSRCLLEDCVKDNYYARFHPHS